MIIGTTTDGMTLDASVSISETARARHTYIIGATGTGKSVLLENLIGQAMQNGEGLCFLDPHGDTAQNLVNHLPDERKDDLVYLDLSNVNEPVGLNFLTDIPTDMRPLYAQNIVAAFKHIYGDDSWGPRMEYVFLMSVRTLMESNLTLLALPRLFYDEQFRSRIISRITDPYVKEVFWAVQFPAWYKKFGPELTSPIENKIGAVLGSPHLRAIISQKKNTISLRNIMDTGKVLIVSLQKGQIGELAASLFGALLVSFIGQTALSRSDIPEEDRVPFTLFCDEFQNYATSGFPLIMSEARKYKLSLVLAHQGLSQVDTNVTDSVFANCGTFLSFRIGVNDANTIAKLFQISESALLDLQNFHLWYRAIAPATAKLVRTNQPPFPLHDKAREFILYSQRRFGRHYQGVQKNIAEFLCAPHSKTSRASSAFGSTSSSTSPRRRKR